MFQKPGILSVCLKTPISSSNKYGCIPKKYDTVSSVIQNIGLSKKLFLVNGYQFDILSKLMTWI